MVSSYIPTVSSLIRARRNFNTKLRIADAKVLLGAVPYPGGGAEALPETIEEVITLHTIIPSSNLLTIPIMEDCAQPMVGIQTHGLTQQTVLSQLPSTTIFHIACHGVQNSENPLDSGLILQDGLLKLSTLMGINLQHGFLAFLSACHSAKGDKKNQDQAVHLAAAMLFVGFQSVVATMWCV